ncbi:MAG TPA: 23S rRNA (adenine(2503)-C(2))-methyltransferase RlmN [Chloroflexota bacterium]
MNIPTTASSTPLSAMTAGESEAWAKDEGLPAYRGRQLFAALSKRAIQSVAEITEFPAALRSRLEADRAVRSVRVLSHLRSGADGSEKVLFGLTDGAAVETVLIPSSRRAGRQRFTVCVSSQVGCPAGCTFCATGLGGFGRNLGGYEIVDQVQYFAHALRQSGQHVTNVVFMGMGEPFLNVPGVRDAVERLTDAAGFGLGNRHITVSTVGIVPQIRRFAEWGGQVNLAISLHAPNDDLRSRLVPYNEHFPIADILSVTREYVERTHRRVSFEYVLLKGTNDSRPLARELAGLLLPLGGAAHVNLIPWNPFREGQFRRSEGPDAESFRRELLAAGLNATIRYSKGLDISAACGQLRESHETATASGLSNAVVIRQLSPTPQ